MQTLPLPNIYWLTQTVPSSLSTVILLCWPVCTLTFNFMCWKLFIKHLRNHIFADKRNSYITYNLVVVPIWRYWIQGKLRVLPPILTAFIEHSPVPIH